MRVTQLQGPDQSNAVDAARLAIWRLFEQGYVDEDMATAGLLAVDLGTRRAQRREFAASHDQEAGHPEDQFADSVV